MRYKITIEYNGSKFSGWQKQNHPISSVQETIENAICSFTSEKVTLYCGGRTDAGVHALGQVAHFDISREFEPYRVRNAANYHLRSADIAIINAEIVNETFHARFSAKQRHYEYRIINRYSPTVLESGRVWQIFKPLNIEIMCKAAQYLLGKHNFSSFRSKYCQSKSPIKTIDNIEMIQNQDHLYIRISALSFLHNQVRIMVGTLVEFGSNNIDPDQMLKILNNRERNYAGITAPPYGLYLVGIDY